MRSVHFTNFESKVCGGGEAPEGAGGAWAHYYVQGSKFRKSIRGNPRSAVVIFFSIT